MVVTMLAIAGFQAYWLRDNYLKEKKNLQLRTDVTFAETIKRLQARKLKLDRFFNDSSNHFRIEVEDGKMVPPVPLPPEEYAGIINDVTVRVSDSLAGGEIMRRRPVREWIEEPGQGDERMLDTIVTGHADRKNMIISLNKQGLASMRDSTGQLKIKKAGPSGEIISFLYRVDSLQDSLRVAEIDSACRLALQKERIGVPFTITRTDSNFNIPLRVTENRPLNKVTLGFRHPVTYELNLGNTFGYLVGKIISPLLFSIFLVGVTLLSFLLLYRNLLKQRKLAEIKNEFISNITHELKTPIATVNVAIEALRNFNAINDPQRTKEYLDISQNELHRLSLLVDKVLKLSMFEKQEIELKYEELDLNDVVSEVVSSMKLQIEKNQATVSVEREGNTVLQGDRLHMLSVVFNLVDNALKYGKPNTAVRIGLKETEEGVELSVADNGVGIAPEYRDKVFEKFFRVPAGDRHNTKGYGLGLSYVAHVISRHHGNIKIDSQPGLGTKFIITLPRQAV